MEVEDIGQAGDHQRQAHLAGVCDHAQPAAREQRRLPQHDQNGQAGCAEEPDPAEVDDQMAGGPHVRDELITHERTGGRVRFSVHGDDDASALTARGDAQERRPVDQDRLQGDVRGLIEVCHEPSLVGLRRAGVRGT